MQRIRIISSIQFDESVLDFFVAFNPCVAFDLYILQRSVKTPVWMVDKKGFGLAWSQVLNNFRELFDKLIIINDEYINDILQSSLQLIKVNAIPVYVVSLTGYHSPPVNYCADPQFVVSDLSEPGITESML